MNPSHRQQGLTLVELLIALGLGAFLTVGVLNVFISNSQSMRIERALSQVQQSGRAAVELINKDVRRAGYIGCTSIGGRVDVAADGIEVQRLLAYSATAASLVPDPAGQAAAVVAGQARAGTDVLVLDYADYLGDDLIGSGTSFSALGSSIQLDGQSASTNGNECRFASDDLVLFSNCLTTHVFRVSSATGCGTDNNLTINPAENGGPGAAQTFLYDEGSDVAEYLQYIWFVADSGRDYNGQDVYALYRLPSNQPFSAREEMVEGVEFMRIELGERVGSGVRFVEPDTPGILWSNIESMRVALLVQSFERVTSADDVSVYALLNTTVGPGKPFTHAGGRMVRRVYTSSQVIRNTDYGG